MTADLTLPGTIPGLLRRGSPVVLGRTHLTVTSEALPVGEADIAYAIKIGIPSSMLPVLGAPTRLIGPGRDNPCPEANLKLRVADATGRAHATWWLAAKLWPEDGPYIAAAVLPGRTIGPLRMGISTISAQEGDRWRGMPGAAEDALADLDPADPRLLPDGSRLVDALALVRVCLHVAGVTRG